MSPGGMHRRPNAHYRTGLAAGGASQWPRARGNSIHSDDATPRRRLALGAAARREPGGGHNRSRRRAGRRRSATAGSASCSATAGSLRSPTSASAASIKLKDDGFRVVVDGTTLDSATLRTAAPERPAGPRRLRLVVRRLRADGHLRDRAGVAFRQQADCDRQGAGRDLSGQRGAGLSRRTARAGRRPLRARRRGRASLGTGDYGVFLRFADRRGLLAAVQNPFLQIDGSGPAFAVRYAPDMEWRSEYGPFVADRGMLAPYRQTGRVAAVTDAGGVGAAHRRSQRRPEWTKRRSRPSPISCGRSSSTGRRVRSTSWSAGA